MRALLLSPYDAASHRQWAKGLAGLEGLDLTIVKMPPRHFAWRVRGNALHFARAHGDILRRPYDAVLATSMTELATLRGLVAELGSRPTLLYHHENQFVYPRNPRAPRSLDPHLAVHALYGAMASDRLLFNSEYNRSTYFDGLRAFLRRMPDFAHPSVCRELRARSTVVPVPIPDDAFVRPTRRPSGPLRILWNHRWEYDKAPERFFGALYDLAESGADFRVHVVGPRFRKWPIAFDEGAARLEPQIVTWGTAETRREYLGILRDSDVVVSTALHEFQGVAVLEAWAAGCSPLVPDRLAYRELIPDRYRYASFEEDADAERAALVSRLTAWAANPGEVRSGVPAPPDALRWSELGPRYLAEINQLIGT